VGSERRHRVTVLGLGEAGTVIAGQLAERGFDVRAFDPRPQPEPAGVVRCTDPCEAARDTTAVLALTAAKDARDALTQTLEGLPAGALYADLSTAAPDLKRELAGIAQGAGQRFVDVALMGTVEADGIATPQLAAGAGAQAYADLLASAGGRVTVVGSAAGDAAARKLLRSVVIKGLTAALLEGLRAAEAAGLAGWLWEHLAEDSPLEEAFLRRLVEGTQEHVGRRRDEMQAAVDLLEELGVSPTMAAATLQTLQAIDGEALRDLIPPASGADHQSPHQ
jgi:3-hydroxyisobutyrate dehydrogenase-like beta-hydroxyacid dehydrogenase